MRARRRSRGLSWLLTLCLALAWLPACRSGLTRANKPKPASLQPRAERWSQIKTQPAQAAVGAPEHPTRTAVDDLPCQATATWLKDVLPAEENAADWDRPLDAWSRERAVALLLTADRVRGPSVGPKGRVPPHVWATMVLTRQPDVLCAAAWVMKRAPLPGRIYALAALFLADRAHFDSVAVDYAELPAPVPVTFGLVDSEARASELVARIRTGELANAWRAATQPLSADDEEDEPAKP